MPTEDDRLIHSLKMRNIAAGEILGAAFGPDGNFLLAEAATRLQGSLKMQCERADLLTEEVAQQKAEVARLRGLLDSRTLADALTLTKPLRIALGWTRHRAQTAEQIIAEAVTTLNEYPAIMQAANDRAEKAEASQRADTEAARAQLAELQAAVEAQTEAAKKASEQQALGKPDEPITVARALLKQAASTVDLADRLALVTEARQWAALDR